MDENDGVLAVADSGGGGAHGGGSRRLRLLQKGWDGAESCGYSVFIARRHAEAR
jgi:hypothetical protein